MNMELITTTCPACGGSIHVQSNQKQCYCTFCGSQVLIDNGEKTFTYRTVDEARLRELELENKRLEMAERHRPQRMKMALGLALVGALLLVGGWFAGQASGDGNSGWYLVSFLGLMSLMGSIFPLIIDDDMVKRDDSA